MFASSYSRIDETNFNLFCRRGKGWSAIGSRSVVLLRNSKGPKVHVIGAISTEGMSDAVLYSKNRFIKGPAKGITFTQKVRPFVLN